MNQVKEIIQSVLDEHRGTCENEELAAKCTAKLTEATIKEVAVCWAALQAPWMVALQFTLILKLGTIKCGHSDFQQLV